MHGALCVLLCAQQHLMQPIAHCQQLLATDSVVVLRN